MAEETLLKEGDVWVSTARFVTGPNTYPLTGITAVSSTEVAPNRSPGILLILLGLLCGGLGYLGGPSSAWFAAVFFVGAGIAWNVIVKSRFAVGIATSGGQVHAVIDRDPQKIGRIVTALNDALARR
jgi:hypothetical protein